MGNPFSTFGALPHIPPPAIPVTSSQRPASPSASGQQVCKCMWANCGRIFDSFPALVGHVNVDHLRHGSSLPLSPPSSTLSMSPLVPPVHQAQQQQSLTFGFHNEPSIPCHWSGCGEAVPLAGGAAHTLPQLKDGSALSPLAAHLLQDHLGVPMDILSTWPHPTVQDLLAIMPTQAALAAPTQRSGGNGGRPSRQGKQQHQQRPPEPPLSPASLTPSSPSIAPNGIASSSNSGGDNGGSDAGYVCRWEGCRESFASVDALTQHLDDTHVGSGRAWYECHWEGCTRCGERGFGSRQKVRRHLQSHTGHRPFACKICGQNFSEAATLQQHLRRHTQHSEFFYPSRMSLMIDCCSTEPYVCDFPGCGKAFTVTGALTIHKRTHNGHKPFRCTYCDK
jgi:hypothetical protein